MKAILLKWISSFLLVSLPSDVTSSVSWIDISSPQEIPNPEVIDVGNERHLQSCSQVHSGTQYSDMFFSEEIWTTPTVSAPIIVRWSNTCDLSLQRYGDNLTNYYVLFIQSIPNAYSTYIYDTLESAYNHLIIGGTPGYDRVVFHVQDLQSAQSSLSFNGNHQSNWPNYRKASSTEAWFQNEALMLGGSNGFGGRFTWDNSQVQNLLDGNPASFSKLIYSNSTQSNGVSRLVSKNQIRILGEDFFYYINRKFVHSTTGPSLSTNFLQMHNGTGGANNPSFSRCENTDGAEFVLTAGSEIGFCCGNQCTHDVSTKIWKSVLCDITINNCYNPLLANCEVQTKPCEQIISAPQDQVHSLYPNHRSPIPEENNWVFIGTEDFTGGLLHIAERSVVGSGSSSDMQMEARWPIPFDDAGDGNGKYELTLFLRRSMSGSEIASTPIARVRVYSHSTNQELEDSTITASMIPGNTFSPVTVQVTIADRHLQDVGFILEAMPGQYSRIYLSYVRVEYLHYDTLTPTQNPTTFPTRHPTSFPTRHPTSSPTVSQESLCDTTVSVYIFTDNYPQETTWQLRQNPSNQVVLSGGPYNSNLVRYDHHVCVQDDSGITYTFTIWDSANDGVCCGYGSGWFGIDVANVNVMRPNSAFSNSWYGSFPAVDMRDPLVSYVTTGNCGIKGDDAQADFSQCQYGAKLKYSNDIGGGVVAVVNSCDYTSYSVYECNEISDLQIGDSEFYTDDIPRTWNECKNQAATLGLDFASIHTVEENNIISATGTRFLTGGYHNSENNWLWDDGTLFDYKNWKSGQPNNLRNSAGDRQDVIDILGNGEWTDVYLTDTAKCLFRAPVSTLKIGNTPFYTDGVSRMYNDCKDHAYKRGLVPASVHSDAEMNMIPSGTSYWLGGRLNRFLEWGRWDDGTPWDYTKWAGATGVDNFAFAEGGFFKESSSRSQRVCLWRDPTLVQLGSSIFYSDGVERSFGGCELAAQSYNLHMASIHTGAENAIIKKLVYLLSSHHWLGGYKSGSNWVWRDGSPMSYTQWQNGQPNDRLGREKHIVMSTGGGWNDLNMQNAYKCVFRAPFGINAMIAGTEYHTDGTPRFYDDCKDAAEKFNMDLASIRSDAESTLLGNNIGVASWIGGERDNAASPWKWSDGSPWDYTKWKAGEPNSQTLENSIQFDPDATWLDKSGTAVSLPCIFMTSIERLHLGVNTFFSVGESPFYSDLVTRNHGDCTSVGIEKGLLMASVHSIAENEALHRMNKNAWLGGYKDTNGWGKWDDGTPWDYTNWKTGQPSNGSNEHNLFINTSGKWLDNSDRQYICIWRKPTLLNIGGSFFMDYLPRTWYGCWSAAEEYGLTFASVQSSSENAIITNFNTENWTFWIGGSLVSNSWNWLDGTAMSYTNWAPGHPNNNEDHMTLVNQGWVDEDEEQVHYCLFRS